MPTICPVLRWLLSFQKRESWSNFLSMSKSFLEKPNEVCTHETIINPDINIFFKYRRINCARAEGIKENKMILGAHSCGVWSFNKQQ